MSDNRNASDKEIEAFSNDFKTRLKLAHDVFRDRAFRYENEKGELEISQPGRKVA